MSSGAKNVVIQTQERAVSTDVNRLQAFAMATFAEYARHNVNVACGTDDLDAGGTETPVTTLTSPVTAEIFGAGLLVRPTAGTLSFTVDAGMAMFINPDADPDASVYKIANDPGLLTGVLNFGAGGGSIRIDIVECQWTDSVVETDNRDIFNDSLNLFAATTVTKATAGRLTYRVRAGVAGSGFPGTASGWLPLAVVSVPAGATSVDQMTFWDVRPLISDRVFNGNLTRSFVRPLRAIFTTNGLGAPSTNLTLSGLVETEFKGRRLGGRMRRGTPGTDAESIVIGPTTTDNLAAGISISAGGLVNLYLATPFGLPRWARYTDGPSGRVPRSPRGIPIITEVPANHDGTPFAAVPLPTLTGLLGSTSEAICVAVTKATDATHFYPFFGSGPASSQELGFNDDAAVPTMPLTKQATTTTTTRAKWDLVAGTDFPANARRIFVQMTILISGAANPGVMDFTGRIFFPNDATNVAKRFVERGRDGEINNANRAASLSGWAPVAPVYPTNVLGQVYTVEWVHNVGTAATAPNALLSVLGWEF